VKPKNCYFLIIIIIVIYLFENTGGHRSQVIQIKIKHLKQGFQDRKAKKHW